MIWSQRPMAAPFFTRLRRSVVVSGGDLAALSALAVEIRTFDPHATLVPEGRSGDCIHVVLDGWAACVKILENGSRQMPAIFVPGDVCDIGGLFLGHSACSAVALTRCTVALVPREPLIALFDRHRGLRDAFGRIMATQLSTATQWAVCLGRRSARERMAHLLCELFVRLDAVGVAAGAGGPDFAAGGPGFAASGTWCDFPLTQEEMADVLALTAVHVNRTLQALRHDGLIQLRDQRLTIKDWAALKRAGGFDPAYLHLDDAVPAPGILRDVPTGAQSGAQSDAQSGAEMRLSA